MRNMPGWMKIFVMMIGAAGILTALLFIVLPKVAGGPLQIQVGQASSSTPESEISGPAERQTPGIPVSLGERVVNLADPGGYRYIKVEIVLSLNVDGIDTTGMDAHSFEVAQEEVTAELQPFMPQVQDVVTMVLTAQVVADVSTPDGKELVKAQLLEDLAPIFAEHHQDIEAIYFAQFLIQ